MKQTVKFNGRYLWGDEKISTYLNNYLKKFAKNLLMMAHSRNNLRCYLIIIFKICSYDMKRNTYENNFSVLSA